MEKNSRISQIHPEMLKGLLLSQKMSQKAFTSSIKSKSHPHVDKSLGSLNVDYYSAQREAYLCLRFAFIFHISPRRFSVSIGTSQHEFPFVER